MNATYHTQLRHSRTPMIVILHVSQGSPTRRSFLTGRLPIHHGEMLSGDETDDMDLRWNLISQKLALANCTQVHVLAAHAVFSSSRSHPPKYTYTHTFTHTHTSHQSSSHADHPNQPLQTRPTGTEKVTLATCPWRIYQRTVRLRTGPVSCRVHNHTLHLQGDIHARCVPPLISRLSTAKVGSDL